MTAQDIIDKLNNYKKDPIQKPMTMIVRTLDNTDIKILAEYFSSLNQ